jgi:acyl-CoA dehydrogenase
LTREAHVALDFTLAPEHEEIRVRRFDAGADEIHQRRIAERTMAADQDTGPTHVATGGLPL